MNEENQEKKKKQIFQCPEVGYPPVKQIRNVFMSLVCNVSMVLKH